MNLGFAPNRHFEELLCFLLEASPCERCLRPILTRSVSEESIVEDKTKGTMPFFIEALAAKHGLGYQVRLPIPESLRATTRVCRQAIPIPFPYYPLWTGMPFA